MLMAVWGTKNQIDIDWFESGQPSFTMVGNKKWEIARLLYLWEKVGKNGRFSTVMEVNYWVTYLCTKFWMTTDKSNIIS